MGSAPSPTNPNLLLVDCWPSPLRTASPIRTINAVHEPVFGSSDGQFPASPRPNDRRRGGHVPIVKVVFDWLHIDQQRPQNAHPTPGYCWCTGSPQGAAPTLAIVSRNSPELQNQRHRDWLTTTGPGTRCARVCLSLCSFEPAIRWSRTLRPSSPIPQAAITASRGWPACSRSAIPST